MILSYVRFITFFVFRILVKMTKNEKISCTVFAWKWQLIFVTSLPKLTKNENRKMKWTGHYTLDSKDLRGTYVRRMTAATAAITLAFLFVEMLCYVLGRLHSSCVLSTKIVLHRWELINKTLVDNDFSNFFLHFLFIYGKSHKFWKF